MFHDSRHTSRATRGHWFAVPRVLILSLTLLFVGCSSLTAKHTPELYPNEHLSKTPREQVRADIDRCLAMGEEYSSDSNRYGQIAKEGVVGGAIGAGTGAIAGTIAGNAGRGTGAGAAVGAIVAILNGLYHMNDRSPTQQRFVEHCLEREGYEVIGWGSGASSVY